MHPFERMTDRSRIVMRLAEREAMRRGAAAVEPEHVLLALALEGKGVAAHILQFYGVSAERIAEQLPTPTSKLASGTGPFPGSTGTEQVAAQALVEMSSLNHHYMGTEHLILAVVATGGEVVSSMLAQLHISPELLRREIYMLLGHDPPST